MARKEVNIGTTGNDATGDSIRTAFGKVNTNFTELYAALGLGGGLNFQNLDNTPSTISANKVIATNNNGDAIVEKELQGDGLTIDNSTDPTKIIIRNTGTELVRDTSPQLGGTLDLNSNDISGTGSIDITGSIDVSDHILFGGNTHGSVTHAEGNVYYDSTHKALSLQSEDSGLEMELGQNEYIRVYNNTGSTINKGAPIYLNGQTSGIPNAALADASDSTKYNISGLASSNISNSSQLQKTITLYCPDF